MSKIILYGAGRVSQSMQTLNIGSGSMGVISVTPFKSTDGTTYNNVCSTSSQGAGTYKNMSLFQGLTGYVSADTEADFDITDYTTNAIADVSSSSTSAQNGTTGRTYTITATNNGASAVTVGSIKFTKEMQTKPESSWVYPVCLALGYFLDTPVTLGVGETKTFAVTLDFWNY